MTATIADRYRSVVARVAEAAIRARRDPTEVVIVVAAKTFGVDAIREVVAAGARDIGENYVQEARRKAADLEGEGVRWHLIGRLQRNKAALAVKLFHLVHSLDRIELARDLEEAARKSGRRARCLIEVNLGAEATKGGAAIEAVAPLLEAAATLPALEIHGLMAIPPPGTAEDSRRSFARLRALRDQLCRLRLPNVRLKELSMGMSSDFEAAVGEGATIVRIGTAIFGPRS
jgi:pyridoxal phosphate enzyme (YggS family)